MKMMFNIISCKGSTPFHPFSIDSVLVTLPRAQDESKRNSDEQGAEG